MQKTPDTIRQLQSDPRIYGTCPHCGEAFSLRKARLFYANRAMPTDVKNLVTQRRNELIQQQEDLRRRRRQASIGAEQLALRVNLGIALERVAPVLNGFGHNLRDCRPLSEPIDYIVFNGLARHGEIDSLTFIDIKTGGSTLNARQRQIRDAVNSGRVNWEQYALENPGS